jgi:peptidoglycan/xylan/chitin deacetylase (PgdA/CDA1 family)
MPSRTAWRVARDYKVVMWSWLSYDFDVEIPISEILKKARKQLKGGEVLVLHDNEKVHDRVVQLLPELIKVIREKGLEFEIISA